jgi:threonine/homoserine efflux transporter RhtA
VSDFVWLRLASAGLPVRLPLGQGVSPVDGAATTVALLEALR